MLNVLAKHLAPESKAGSLASTLGMMFGGKAGVSGKLSRQRWPVWYKIGNQCG
jgi:hypothetical protein